MELALLNNDRVKAEPGLKGLCPGCLQPVIAKCGTQRIYHWAHRTNKPCDSWYERETEWHRSWKNKFPEKWQEVFLPDQLTGEKHMADVRTPDGLVIEFQHSHIHPQERASRERFYQTMVWVVDGTRLENDYKRFLKGEFRLIRNGIFRVATPDGCFPKTWRESSVSVIFDFKGHNSIGDNKDDLYLLFPKRLGEDAIVAVIARRAFIDAASNGKLVPWVQAHVKNIVQVDQELQRQREIQQQQHSNLMFDRFTQAARYRRRRRRF